MLWSAYHCVHGTYHCVRGTSCLCTLSASAFMHETMIPTSARILLKIFSWRLKYSSDTIHCYQERIVRAAAMHSCCYLGLFTLDTKNRIQCALNVHWLRQRSHLVLTIWFVVMRIEGALNPTHFWRWIET